MKVLRVALDVPVDTLFEYRADQAVPVAPGQRVAVPFGRRQLVGVVHDIAQHSGIDSARLKSIVRILDETPPLSPDLLALLDFCSRYYHHPLGEVVLNALPTALRRTGSIAKRRPIRYALTPSGRSAALPSSRISVKRRLLELFRREATLGRDDALRLSRRAAAVLDEFIGHGWVTECLPQVHPPWVAAAAPQLSPEQAIAVETIGQIANAFSPWLLHGITGSGKTEVYLRLTADALRSGRQTLVLVPEINLTPQLEDTFRARFGHARLVTLHSGLNEGERVQHWLNAQSGEARIVLGTRLAVFAPLPELGLIIVDEEHDASYKQNEGLRYSARDVAVFRAKQRRVPIVLGSATPSLETLRQVEVGRYRSVRMTRRINAGLPTLELIGTRGQRLADGLSERLLAAIGERLQRGDQAMVFINRRGYAPVLLCHACGWAANCHRCSARLVLHLRDGCLRCHHCGHEQRTPTACPDCGNQALAPLGAGTQRLEQALATAFPKARILRIDRDSTRRKLAWREMRRLIEQQRVDILVGTQLLAKGHDFPKLNLVGVVNADASLYSVDFRAAERLFAQLTQVSGRAGRGENAGEVLVQTDFPMHPLFRALARHDFLAFSATLMDERKQAALPPFVHQALLRAEAPLLEASLQFLLHARRIAAAVAHPSIVLFDPVAAPMARLAGRERAQLLVQSPSRSKLQAFLTEWYRRISTPANRKVRWTLDVDPLEI